MSELSNSKAEGGTILIVDDNTNNLRVLGNMLKEIGFSVRVATNGEEALASVAAAAPDIIILDIHMPKMDGYDACEILKSNEVTRDIPVIFASALSDSYNVVKGFELGGVDYITKPLNLEELKARVLTHYTLSRQHRFLQEKSEELRLFNEVMLKRESRIIELKDEVNELASELDREPPYAAVWDR